ncbi:MAG: hypothetical protein JO288_06305 [Hyphomicrobiales bacterium]|nr:hypothetical protein [Hyphomicrobiales bacterium]
MRTLACAAGLGWALSTAAVAGAFGAPTLTPVGPVDPVFVWAASRCADDDIPDAPLRSVRLAPTGVVAFSTHFLNRRFIGAGLNSMARDCAVVFSGKGSPNPEDYSDRVWIASTWSEDGRTIFALGHDEYQAHRHPGRCRFSTYLECWYNAIVLLRSDDGGRTFARVGDRPVASIPIRQDVDQGHNRGFFEPSNILKRGDAYFALIRAGSEGAQQAGTCLFRTDDLSRPESWRFYDGQGFSANVDPYRDDVSQAKPCAPLQGLKGMVGSVVYAEDFDAYVAVSDFGSQKPGESGFYYSVSTDLIHWSEGRLFLPLATTWTHACDQDHFAYPSLIDVDSPSRNFDVVGNEPYLYFVRRRFDGCQGTMQRDLVRMKLRLLPE